MNNSRFISLLQTFSKIELDSFGRYLICFYPKMKRAIALYGYLEKLHPNFTDSTLSLEEIIKNTSNGNTIHLNGKEKKNMLNTFSDLYNWAIDFLVWQRQTKDPLRKDMIWLEILAEKGMDHEYQLKAAQINKVLAEKKIKDTWDHLDRLRFHHNIWEHHTTKRHTPHLDSIAECMNELDQFYVLSKITYSTEMLNRASLLRAPTDVNILEDVLPKLESHPNHLLMGIARLQYELVKYKREEDYQALKNLYIEKAHFVSLSGQSILYQHLINYTAPKIRNGEQGYYLEAFELHNSAILSGLLTLQGYISSHTFQNIVSTAIQLEKTSWAEDFIYKHTHLLEKKTQYQTVCFTNAQVAFAKKDHDSNWFSKLQTIKYSDPFFAIRVKTLILRNSYEGGNDRSYLLLINLAFRKYLARNKKLTPEILNSCMNLSNRFSELVNKRVSKSKFIENVKNSSPLFFESWLLEKANDLEEDNESSNEQPK